MRKIITAIALACALAITTCLCYALVKVAAVADKSAATIDRADKLIDRANTQLDDEFFKNAKNYV